MTARAPALAAPPAAAGWQCGRHCFDLQRPLVMGIINITPDSFSDGGAISTAACAYRRGMAMLEEGADILDIGGESTRPGAAAVDTEEEKRRVLPAVEKLAAAGAVVSADTMKPAVMRAALDAGAAIINDVNGFCAAGAVEAAAASGCGLVVMHMRGQPRTMQENPAYGDVVEEVAAFLRARCAALAAAGVAAARLCVDPGIGFGKTRAHNIALLNNLRRVAGDFPALVGVSRKSIFSTIGGGAEAAQRDGMSAVAAALLLERGAGILRVHNVAMTVQAVAVWRLVGGHSA